MGFRQNPGLVEELESYLELVAETVICLLPNAMAWFGLSKFRAYLHTLDTKLIGLIDISVLAS